MVTATHKLINQLENNENDQNSNMIDTFISIILSIGGEPDMQLLLNHYLKNPFNYENIKLLPIFEKFGNNNTANEIFNYTIINNRLIDEENNNLFGSKILETLGNMKYIPAKNTLIYYAFQTDENYNYELNTSSILGLLNFDCNDIEEKIISEIEKTYNKSVFPEFIPTLVCKVNNKTVILERLFELCNYYSFPSYCGGIILGFSLCDEIGKNYFLKSIFNEKCEVGSGSLGHMKYVFKGIINLGINFTELYEIVYKEEDKGKALYSFTVFINIIKFRIVHPNIQNNKLETLDEILELFFDYDSKLHKLLSKLTYEYEYFVELDCLEELIKIKMREDLILELLNTN